MSVVEHLELQNLLQVIVRRQQILTIVVPTESIAIDARVQKQIKLAQIEIKNFSLIWRHQRNELKQLLCLMNLVVVSEVLNAHELLVILDTSNELFSILQGLFLISNVWCTVQLHHHLVIQSIKFVPFCEISDSIVINKRFVRTDLFIPRLELQVLLQGDECVH